MPDIIKKVKEPRSPFSFKNKPLHIVPQQPISTFPERGRGRNRGTKGGEDKDDAPLGHDDGNVPPNIQLSAHVRSRYLHIRIPQALHQRTTKHRAGWRRHIYLGGPVPLRLRLRVAGMRRRRTGFLSRSSDMLPPRAEPRSGIAVVVVMMMIAVLGSHKTKTLLFVGCGCGYGCGGEQNGSGGRERNGTGWRG